MTTYPAIETSVRNLLHSNQAFFVTTGSITQGNATNLQTCVMSIFNPASHNQGIYIVSLNVYASNSRSGSNAIYYTTADPGNVSGMNNQLTPVVYKPGSTATSQASCWSSPTGQNVSVTPSGTQVRAYAFVGNTDIDLCANEMGIYLPGGVGCGIQVMLFQAQANPNIAGSARYIEF